MSGDRSRGFSLSLGVQTHALAVCDGFGAVDGITIAEAALARLHGALRQRARSARFMHQLDRPKSAATALTSLLYRLNRDIYARSASHEDYVTCGASLTLAIIHRERTYVAHIGNSAAYLSRGGYVIALTTDDAVSFEPPSRRGVAVTANPPLLTRALGTAPQLEASVCSFRLNPDDALVLATKRMGGLDDRRTLSQWLLHGRVPSETERTLVVARRSATAPERVAAIEPVDYSPVMRVVAAIVALAFLLLLA